MADPNYDQFHYGIARVIRQPEFCILINDLTRFAEILSATNTPHEFDGKLYFYEATAMPTAANWQTTIRSIDNSGCQTDFGPSNEPDVLDDADIFIFANDISFSNPTPDTSETIVISAVIHNESDFPANNFVVHLVNQFDPGIVYPDNFVALLPAHSTTTVQWTIVTPNVPSWNPMQVFIDYTNVITEPNTNNILSIISGTVYYIGKEKKKEEELNKKEENYIDSLNYYFKI
jgi:hypothetical protein